MARRIIAHALKMAQLPEPAARRFAAFFEHGPQLIARFDQLIKSGANRMFGENGRRRLTERARFGVDSDGFHRIAILGQFHIDPHRRAANPRDFRGRPVRIIERSDMRNSGRKFENTIVIQVYHGAHVALNGAKIKPYTKGSTAQTRISV